MATDKSYLDYILDCLSHIDGISARPMMGEYLIYFRGKYVAAVCDNRFLVKDTINSDIIMTNAVRESPYDVAKPMIVVDDPDDKDKMKAVFNALYLDIKDKTR